MKPPAADDPRLAGLLAGILAGAPEAGWPPDRAPARSRGGRRRNRRDARHHGLRHRARHDVPRLLSRRPGHRRGGAGSLGRAARPGSRRPGRPSPTPSACSASPRPRRCRIDQRPWCCAVVPAARWAAVPAARAGPRCRRGALGRGAGLWCWPWCRRARPRQGGASAAARAARGQGTRAAGGRAAAGRAVGCSGGRIGCRHGRGPRPRARLMTLADQSGGRQVANASSAATSEATSRVAPNSSAHTTAGPGSCPVFRVAALWNATRPELVRQVVRSTTAHESFGPSYSPTRSPAQAETAAAAELCSAEDGDSPSSQMPSWNSPSVSCMVSFQPLPRAVGTGGTVTETGSTPSAYSSG